MIVGLHLSREKSLLQTIARVREYGGNALQLFSSNPRSIRPADIHKFDKEAEDVVITCKNSNFKLVLHSAYVINPASDAQRFESLDDTYWYQTIVADLDIAERLHAIGSVIHVGKHTKLTKEEGLKNMKHFIRYTIQYLKKKRYNTRLLLETAAGQGTELCVDIDEFIDLYNEIGDHNNFGICFDTCHVWVAGFDIVDAFKKIQKKTNHGIRVIHLNGSMVPYGSKKDRHAPILHNSTIPLDMIDRFMAEARKYPEIVIILETPDHDPSREIKYLEKKMI